MADQLPFLGDGSLAQAYQALRNRPQQLAQQEAAAMGGGASQGMPQPAPMVPAGMPGSRNLGGGRPTVTPQQQAQLVALLRARMQQQQQEQQQAPQQPQPQQAPQPMPGGMP